MTIYATLTPAQHAAAAELMDDDLREEIAANITSIIDDDRFLQVYADRHLERYGERFEPAYIDGVW